MIMCNVVRCMGGLAVEWGDRGSLQRFLLFPLNQLAKSNVGHWETCQSRLCNLWGIGKLVSQGCVIWIPL